MPTAPTDFLVMELLEGQTLAQRLAKDALPIDQALDLGAQIAEALSSAHRHGIIHRDLKPANVMLTKTGVKLLDFGLAKLKAPPAASTDGVSAIGTQTENGQVLGTVPYMAPEQVEGKGADARTDLFAFGALLYEIVTGKRAFEGTSSASVMAAILEHEPPAVSSLQPLTPPGLDPLVKRCLAKDPDERWQNAHDLADELRWMIQDCGAVPGTGASARTRRQRRWRRLVVAAGGLLLFAAGIGVMWLLRPVEPRPAVVRSTLNVLPADGLLGGYPGNTNTAFSLNRPSRTVLALTPDGRRLVFAGRQGSRDQLWVKDLSEKEARPIPNTDRAEAPFLSPDGREVGFWTPGVRDSPGVWKRVSVDDSGAPVVLGEGGWPFGASWGDDDRIVFATSEMSGLWQVSRNGGQPQAITTLAKNEYSHRHPHVLPNARAVLLTVLEQPWNWETARVVVKRFESPDYHEVVRGAADARYVRTGHLIYFRRGSLRAARFDLERLTTTGDEVGLESGVMQSTNGSSTGLDTGAALATVSATGTLAYVAGKEVPDILRRLVWVDRTGRIEPLSVRPWPYSVPRLAPDEQRVAVQTWQSERRVWVHDLRVPESLDVVTPREMGALHPVWTRLGDRLAFGGYSQGGLGLFLVRPGSPEPPELLAFAEPSFVVPASWTPDGRLLYITFDSKMGRDIWSLSQAGNTWTSRALYATDAAETYAQVSPNGHWLAYCSNETGERSIYIARFPSLSDRRRVAGGGAAAPVWARNGRELFYLRGAEGDYELVVHDVEPDGEVAPTGRALFRLKPLQLAFYQPVPGFDVTQDGQRFLFAQNPDTPSPPLVREITIVLNWFEELKAKVPTK